MMEIEVHVSRAGVRTIGNAVLQKGEARYITQQGGNINNWQCCISEEEVKHIT